MRSRRRAKCGVLRFVLFVSQHASAGATARVYEAFDLQCGGKVALKASILFNTRPVAVSAGFLTTRKPR